MSVFEENALTPVFPSPIPITPNDDFYSNVLPGKTDLGALKGEEAKRLLEPLKNGTPVIYRDTVVVNGFRVPREFQEKVNKTLSFNRPEEAKNKDSAITLANAVNPRIKQFTVVGFLVLIFFLSREFG